MYRIVSHELSQVERQLIELPSSSYVMTVLSDGGNLSIVCLVSEIDIARKAKTTFCIDIRKTNDIVTRLTSPCYYYGYVSDGAKHVMGDIPIFRGLA